MPKIPINIIDQFENSENNNFGWIDSSFIGD